MFMTDLSRAISLPVDVDFMAVSSYGSATRTSGVVRIVKDLDMDLTDRHVLVVEDIVDSGLTLSYLQRYLRARNPASLEVCALLVKEGQQRTELDLRYVGFHIPPEFVVGYGLDVDERLRNLKAIYAYAAPPVVGQRPPGERRHRPHRAGCPRDPDGSGRGPGRDGLLRTPVAGGRKMYEELFAGFGENPADHLEVTFAADHDEMVMVRDIPFASLCEHHLVPFIGKGPRRLHPRRRRPDHRAVQAGPPGGRLRQAAAGAGADDHGDRRRHRGGTGTEGRARGGGRRAPVHVDAGGEEVGHVDRHLGGPRALPERRIGHPVRGHAVRPRPLIDPPGRERVAPCWFTLCPHARTDDRPDTTPGDGDPQCHP
jgi:hypoxanthine phosphoribosyltransferase